MENGQELTLDQVWYVPRIKKSLLSVEQLNLQGYSTIFTGGTWKIVRGTRLIAQGSKRGILYCLLLFNLLQLQMQKMESNCGTKH